MRALLALALCLAAPPAWGWWDRGRDKVKALQEEYNVGRFESVISQLDQSGLQGLRGYSLKRGYTLLGASYERAGHPDRALGAYQIGVRLFPKDQELLERLSRLMHSSGLDEQAQPLYEQILAVNPYNPWAHLGLAEIDRTLGFYDRSAQHYEAALEGFPDNCDIWLSYAELLYAGRDYPTAELAARRALSGAPSDNGHLVLAQILREMGRVDEALAELAPIAQAGSANARRASALWLMEAGRAAAARVAVEALERAAPGDPLGAYVAARLELQAGRRPQAAAALRRSASRSQDAPFTARVSAALADLMQGRP